MEPTPIGDVLPAALRSMPKQECRPKIVGIDPSLTNTAVVIGDGRTWGLAEFGSDACGDSVVSRAARYDQLVAAIVECLSSGPISAIYIEGYSFGSNKSSATYIREYGGILRWHLVDLTDRVFEVPPTTLKKFVAGSGHAKKNTMLAHIQKRWDVLFENDDQGDAFALYKLGLVAEQIAEADNEAQRQAVKTVLS